METRTQHPIYQLHKTQELNFGAKSPETVAQQAPKKAHFVCKKQQKGRCCRRGTNCEFMFWGTSYGTIFTISTITSKGVFTPDVNC